MTVSLDTVLHLADQLAPHQQARLIEYLTRRLAAAPPPPADVPAPAALPTAWAQLFALSDAIGASTPHAQLGARLTAQRQERERTLAAQAEPDHGHP